MFGASQDRARQLAGRQRWKRISSSGSNSSYRSASSSSQLSQLSHHETSSIFEQNVPRPTPIPEHYAYTGSGSLDNLRHFGGLQHLVQPAAVSDVEEALSRMMAKNQHPRTLQQRSQAEHLSQVLYNDTATDDALPPPSSHFALSSQTKRYGVLGWGAKILQHVRHITEPAPQAHMEDQQSTAVTAYDITSRSISINIANTQPVVSMRGGASPESPNMRIMAQQHSLWASPFNTGLNYRCFVDNLVPQNRAMFQQLFGDMTGSDPMLNSARQRFLLAIGPHCANWFQSILIERAKKILGSTLSGGTQPDDELHEITTTSKQDDGYPLVKAPLLLLALWQAG